MQFSAVATFLISALATTVVADNCIDGYAYCGSDLISKGTKNFSHSSSSHSASGQT